MTENTDISDPAKKISANSLADFINTLNPQYNLAKTTAGNQSLFNQLTDHGNVVEHAMLAYVKEIMSDYKVKLILLGFF